MVFQNDWDPVVIKKPTPTKPHHTPQKQVEIDSESGPPKQASVELRKQIQNARVAKGMSQSQLAQIINEKPAVIQAYESGKAVPDCKVLQKLRKGLGVKLSSK